MGRSILLHKYLLCMYVHLWLGISMFWFDSKIVILWFLVKIRFYFGQSCWSSRHLSNTLYQFRSHPQWPTVAWPSPVYSKKCAVCSPPTDRHWRSLVFSKVPRLFPLGVVTASQHNTAILLWASQDLCWFQMVCPVTDGLVRFSLQLPVKE
jgi:hypothetical protein